MMYSGQTAIDYLATEVSKDDSSVNFYWQKYHSAFRITGDGFEGLQAFGRSENLTESYAWSRVACYNAGSAGWEQNFPNSRCLID